MQGKGLLWNEAWTVLLTETTVCRVGVVKRLWFHFPASDPGWESQAHLGQGVGLFHILLPHLTSVKCSHSVFDMEQSSYGGSD